MARSLRRDQRNGLITTVRYPNFMADAPARAEEEVYLHRPAPDRVLLLERLAHTCREIEEGEVRLAEQRARVAKLEGYDQDATTSRRLLEVLEHIQGMSIADREGIAACLRDNGS